MKNIVQGNYRRFSVTLTQKSGELIEPYVPTDTDEVNISLRGARVYEYKEYEQAENVLTFSDNGCLKVGLYELEVRIVDGEKHRLRCMYREQVRVVASNDDIPADASFDDNAVDLQAAFDVAASVDIVVDDELSLTSENPVQNKVVTAALNTKGDTISNNAASGGYMIYLKNGNTTLSSMGIPWAWNSDDGGFMPRSAYDKLDALPTAAALETSLNGKVDKIFTQPESFGVSINLYSGGTFIDDAFILIDAALDANSKNPVRNSVITAALAGKQDVLTFDTAPTQDSNNPVTSGGLYVVLGDIESILDNINGD